MNIGSFFKKDLSQLQDREQLFSLKVILQKELNREIRLIKIHYETQTEKKWMLIFWTRRDRDETVWFFLCPRRDRDKT